MGWPTIGGEGDGESNWTSSGVIGTDIAKILRKRSKPDNHEHGNGIECAKAGECYQDIEHQMIEGMKGQDPREARRPRSIFGRL
ncbi:hypothetical protein Tco_1123057 [Tanacetum coccineum]|uniref:Uncharacterized protein n=1 Tax=Tanacetum coccineum TaxID=301880 RepID=A0ABQ5J288_9ASTR